MTVEPQDGRPGCLVTMNPWGCIIYPVVAAILIFAAYRFMIWLGVAFAVGS